MTACTLPPASRGEAVLTVLAREVYRNVIMQDSNIYETSQTYIT